MATDPLLALDPLALGGSPGQAYASHRARASGMARYFALTHPLDQVGTAPKAEDRQANEDNMLALIAHLQAATDDSAFAVPGQEPSITLAPKALRRLNRGNGLVGTKGASTERDYDMALKGLVVLLHRYPALLGQDGVDFILNDLVPANLVGGHDPAIEIVEQSAFNFDTPETENHLLMIESSRYLVNQLRFARTGDGNFDNSRNGLATWLVGFLQRVLQHDFLEFNARPYARLQLHPLFNLHEFGGEPVRTAAQMLLDYTMVKFALSSSRGRRVSPFRRLQHRINHWANQRNDLFNDSTDQIAGFFLAYSGLVDAQGNPARFPATLSFTGLIAGLAAYRPPPAAYELALRHEGPGALHRFYHGIRPRLASAPEDAEGGIELYYRSPSFVISAGGCFLTSGYGQDELDLFSKQAWEQTARAQATTLIPTRAETLFHDLLRFEPYPDPTVDPYLDDPDDPDTLHARCVNTGVHSGFMCGANLRPWHKKVFPQEATDSNPLLGEFNGRVYIGWRGSGNDNLTVGEVIRTGIIGADGVKTVEGVENLWGKMALFEKSGSAPALASLGGRLFVAWTGEDDKINLAYLEDLGAGLVGPKGKIRLADTSKKGPALVSHNGQLFLGWTGTGDGQLNVARINLGNTAGGFGISGIAAKTVLLDSSPVAPALASHGGRLFLAWTGTGDGDLNLILSEDNGASFKGKKTFTDSSKKAPALSSNGALFYGWTGTGDGHLNVARVLFGDIAGGSAIQGLEAKSTLGDVSDEAPGLAAADGKLFLTFKGKGNGNLNVLLSADGTFRPGPWTFGNLANLGFYLAIYRAPCTAAPDAGPPDNYGVVHAVEAGGMDFATFQRLTLERNAGLPATFTYGARHDFVTADGRRFHFWISLESQKYTPRVTLDGEPNPVQDFTKLPLADGPYLSAPGGHDGLIEIRHPGCEDHPLVLDFRDAAKPVRQEDKALCPAPWRDRADALVAFARKLLDAGQAGTAQTAMAEATAIYQELPDAGATGHGGSESGPAMVSMLASVGVDYSVELPLLLEWLSNPEFTPYPALASALIQLLTPRPLARPVEIDVVRGFYEDDLGAPSPRKPGDVRMDTLKAAVLASSNNRYGEHVARFDQLLKP